MDIQKIILFILPLFFFFVPKILIRQLYTAYLKDLFFSIAKPTQDEFQKIKEFDDKVSRIGAFIGLLSLTASTFFTLVFDKVYQKSIQFDCICVSLSTIFVLAAPLLIWSNFKKRLDIDNISQNAEFVLALVSSLLILFYTK
jgi:hypothetical protein